MDSTQQTPSGVTKRLLPGHHDREINGEKRRRACKVRFEISVCRANVFNGALAYFIRSEDRAKDLDKLEESRRLGDDKVLRELMYHGTIRVRNTSPLVVSQDEEDQALVMSENLLSLFNNFTASDVHAFHIDDGNYGGDSTIILIRATYHYKRPGPTEKLKEPDITWEIVNNGVLLPSAYALFRFMKMLEDANKSQVEAHHPYLEQTMTKFGQTSRFADHSEILLAVIPYMTVFMDPIAGEYARQAGDVCRYCALTRAQSHVWLKAMEEEARENGETLQWDRISLEEVKKTE